MTNHWIDYQHSDVFLCIGLNTAENHPISMKWIQKARDTKGAKLITVDPRFTRTAAASDIYAPIRPGTNIAFINGLINYALSNRRYHREYVASFTNASYLVNPEYSFSDGLFSGARDEHGQVVYDKSTWTYQHGSDGQVLKDETLEHPQSVFQLMKKHFSRYDLSTVSKITGCPVAKLREVAEVYCSTGQAGKAGNVMYAMGITQFTHGAQNVRSLAILQLLLGNMGIPGGGVNAQRGQSNVQGSTDMAMLYHIIPGYNPVPNEKTHANLAEYIKKETPATSYWTNRPKFLVSMLKAFWGKNARRDNDFAFDYLPKLDKNRSHIAMYKYMGQGEVKGMICWADNPAVGGPTAGRKRNVSANLDWQVVVDLFENETATFWKAPGVDPTKIATEVFLLPAALHIERDGTISNSGRWIQWRNKVVEAPGDAKPDLWIVDRLFKAVRKEYQNDPAAFGAPITEMNWDYGNDADSAKVAMEINGYNTATGEQLPNFTHLADDGSTACGNWVYSGYYADPYAPATKRRVRETEGIGNHPEWAYAWPLNRRIVYNRCSADVSGRPWNPNVPLFWWNGLGWQRNDVPDFNANVAPEVSAKTPFIMVPELQARLFSSTMVEGPFPEHYEPWESPIPNIMSSVQTNPCIETWYPEDRADIGSKEFPYVATSYRLSEHYQSGVMTRNMPWLNEAMPGIFVEISPSLATKIGVRNGEKVIISSKRGQYEAAACVTPRVKPFLVDGKQLEMVGLIWHWGYAGLSKGPIANDISPSIGDANTTIPEYKAFLCNIRKGGS